MLKYLLKPFVFIVHVIKVGYTQPGITVLQEVGLIGYLINQLLVLLAAALVLYAFFFSRVVGLLSLILFVFLILYPSIMCFRRKFRKKMQKMESSGATHLTNKFK